MLNHHAFAGSETTGIALYGSDREQVKFKQVPE